MGVQADEEFFIVRRTVLRASTTAQAASSLKEQSAANTGFD